MNTKINFIIPDFLNVQECIFILDAFKVHKEIIKDGVCVTGLTGQINGCVWNEEYKKFNRYKLGLSILKKLKNKYNDEYNLSLYLIFDKENINYKDLDDEYSNEVLKIFNDKKNYVICKSNKLKEYIKENYKFLNVIGNFGEEEKCKVIVKSSLNRSNEVIENKYKNNLILMPDTGFIGNKKNMYTHTKKDFVVNIFNPKKDNYFTSKNNVSFYEIKMDKNYLSYEDLVEYSKNGINTFMLSGLGVYNYAMYENIVDFIFKDDNQIDIRGQMMNIFQDIINYELIEEYNYRL